uniref:Uncharacterized protein n=1 Tax=Arundo donax TaxID=35708 RepID=A0A0A8ZUW0_ARUDO
MPVPVQVLVWAMAGATVLGGFYAFFVHREAKVSSGDLLISPYYLSSRSCVPPYFIFLAPLLLLDASAPTGLTVSLGGLTNAFVKTRTTR